MKRKKFVSIEEIADFLDYRLRNNSNINRTKIENILKHLIRKKYIIPGTKLTKDDILEVPLRAEIFKYIINNPGTNINEIMNNLNIGSNQILWHLKFLEKFQFIRFIKVGNQKVSFNFEMDKKYDIMYFYLRNKNIRKIIKLLENEKKGLNSTKISKILNMHYYTTMKYLEILNNLKLISMVGEINDNIFYHLNYNNYYDILRTLDMV